jgi:signal transduction histidine kinase
MATEIERRNAEIQRWNEELKRRVEQQTAELKAAQEQILRTRRLTALGSMSAGVVHEINNPMTGLLGLVQLSAREIGSERPEAKMLEKALVQGKRVTRILESFKQFAEQEQELAGKRFSAVTSAKAAVDLFRGQLEEKGIEVSCEFEEDTPDLVGDWVQVGQLLGNLIQNAIDAMPTGGALSVRVQPVGSDAVKLEVEDSGPGIPPDIRERIFDPFYSTKKQTTQIGMGLTICHKVVEAHHGKISVDSEEGQGTTVEVILPAAPESAHLV